jgi:hypothetical protein
MAPKKKQKRNITGLRNQPKATSHVEESVDINFSKAAETCPSNPAMADINGPSDNETPDEGWDAHVKFDSNKPCWELDSEEEDSEHEEDKEGDVEDEVMEAGESNWRNEGLHVGLMVLAIEIGDDPRDEDWIPDELRRKYKARMAKGKCNEEFQSKNDIY